MAKSIQFKVEKGRVLVPVGWACRFACKYCYTRSGEVGPSKVDAEEILQQLEAFASTTAFENIQFGYDGDPFDRPERGIMMLSQLATMGKNISFSTKASLEQETLKALEDIRATLAITDNVLVAFISLSCWVSAHLVEPHTPTPRERMVSIKHLRSVGIPTFIAVRPILPNIPDEEYEQLTEEGIQAGCEGFVLGPLYADDAGRFVRFIPSAMLEKVAHRRITVSWSAHSPVWTRYEDEVRLQRIATMMRQKGARVFLSSMEAVELAHRGGVST